MPAAPCGQYSGDRAPDFLILNGVRAAIRHEVSASFPRLRVLFCLDPAGQLLSADRFQQGRMVGGHVPPDHPDHLVIAIATGYVPAFASDQLHPRASCSARSPQRNARMLA
jgi:hypothetical protein